MIIGNTPSVDVDTKIIIGSGQNFCLNDFSSSILVMVVLMLFDDNSRLNVIFK